MKVLIIEDEKAMSDLIAIKFKVEGFEVEQAATFTEAKNKLAGCDACPFDAILTDYLLPDGDLSDFLTVIRADANLQHLPTIVMTNYIEDLNLEKLKALGVSEAIVKYQVVPAQMVEKIKALIGGGGGVADNSAQPAPQASQPQPAPAAVVDQPQSAAPVASVTQPVPAVPEPDTEQPEEDNV